MSSAGSTTSLFYRDLSARQLTTRSLQDISNGSTVGGFQDLLPKKEGDPEREPRFRIIRSEKGWECSVWDRRTFAAQIRWRNDLAFGPIARGWEMQGSPREPADATRHTRPNYLTRGPQLEIVARPRAVIDDYQLLWREAELSGSSGSAGAQASDDDESPLARRVRAYE